MPWVWVPEDDETGFDRRARERAWRGLSLKSKVFARLIYSGTR